MSPQGWWHRATKAQKLAQIDGGIECGMTCRHIAVACGLPEAGGNAVRLFAVYHGRKPNQHFIMPEGGTGKMLTKHRDAQYRRGEPVDFWGNTQPADEFRLDDPESAVSS